MNIKEIIPLSQDQNGDSVFCDADGETCERVESELEKAELIGKFQVNVINKRIPKFKTPKRWMPVLQQSCPSSSGIVVSIPSIQKDLDENKE